MLDDLSQYYAEHGISALKFSCPHYEDCSRGCEHFTKAKEAFVSTGYENHDLPRLLFISLDSGDADPKAKNRTLQSIRQQEEANFQISSLNDKQSSHWYRTHELAQWFLRKYQWGLRIDQVQHYFAHTNSAKCCMNLKHREKADSRLFDNCREFIPGEVVILSPDIIVTQGDEAEQSINGQFSELDLNKFGITHQDLAEVKVISINGAPVLWVHTFHPSNRWKFNPQREEKFKIYTRIAYDFMIQTKGWISKG